MAMRHANAGEIVDLRPLGERLKQARTTAVVKAGAFEVFRLIVRAGAEIDAHEVAGPITLHCLEGRVRLDLDHSSLDLEAGQWVYLDGGVRHSLKGVEDSSLLVTILFAR